MIRNSGVWLQILATGFAFFLSAVVLQPAMAALLYPGGLPHPNAIPGFSGTVQLIHDADNNPITPNQYYGDIEYAVFNSANFPIAFPGEDAPNLGLPDGEVFYAFQVYNAGTRGDITTFTAGLADLAPFGDGLDDNEFVNLGDQDYVAGTGQDPSSSNVTASAIYGAANGSSVRFNFGTAAAARLNAGEWSSVLFYTSPHGPRWDNGSTLSGQGPSRIPAPEFGIDDNGIPEPASLGLMSLGMLGWLGCSRRR
jgi:hypothetical protein